jgi:hypothetical protein
MIQRAVQCGGLSKRYVFLPTASGEFCGDKEDDAGEVV